MGTGGAWVLGRAGTTLIHLSPVSVTSLIKSSAMLIQKKVLVLLACRNGMSWIREQLDSILSQQDVELSILIQDDNSSDDTKSIIAEYAVTFPSRITVFLNEIGTGSAGANFRKLIARADAEQWDYVALADQDDIWNRDKMSRAITALKLSGSQGYSAAVQAFWPDGRESILPQSPHIRGLDFIFEGAGQGCTFVLPVNVFKHAQQFCRQHEPQLAGFHFHDWLIYILVRTGGGMWCFDPVPVMRYRQHESNDMGARGGLQGLRRRVALIRQGWYAKQLMLAMSVFNLAGGTDPRAGTLEAVLRSPPSLKRRLMLARIVAQHGRRRFSDRCVLTLFALMGWF
jgi:rhamnosyltransferase